MNFIRKEVTPLKKLIKKSKIIVLGAPHSPYKKLKLDNKKIIDVWDFLKKIKSQYLLIGGSGNLGKNIIKFRKNNKLFYPQKKIKHS